MSTSDLNELRLVSASHRHDADVTISNAVFAELIVRASTAERRNRGILLQLSASGGRNIDLRNRAEAAEADVIEEIGNRDAWEERFSALVYTLATIEEVGEWSSSNDIGDRLIDHMAGKIQQLERRAEAAEAKAAGVLALHKRVWHEWTELDGRPGSGWICDYCTPTGRVSVVIMHPCPTFTAAAGDAANEWISINSMSGTVCSACGDPTESEPCQEHQPAAYKECTS